MASKKQVIDPAPLIEKLAARCLEAKGLECSVLGNVIDMLRAAPSVDAVEVVRCKKCRFYGRNVASDFCEWNEIGMKPDDFCSYGERKDNDS